MYPSFNPQQPFVWSLLNHQGRERLEGIVKRKEAERQVGNTAWISIGTSLGGNLHTTAMKLRGALDVVFCAALNPSKISGDPHYLWTSWEDRHGNRGVIPRHVLVVGPRKKKPHEYALICTSEERPFALYPQRFCTGDYQNYPSGTPVSPGFPQRAALVTGRLPAICGSGAEYEEGFTATLIKPWQVKVIADRPLTNEEWERIRDWERIGTYAQWQDLVDSIRHPGRLSSSASI